MLSKRLHTGDNAMIGRRLTLAAAALALLAVISTTTSAEAADKWSDGPSKASVFPEFGSLYTYMESGDAVVAHYIRWDSARRMELIRQSDDAYEHEVNFDQDACFGRDGVWVKTGDNIPSDYMDTNLDDSPPPYSRAFGSGNSNQLQPGVTYYFTMEGRNVQNFPLCSTASGNDFYVAGQDSHRSGTCGLGFEYCVFSDAEFPADIVPRSAGWTSGGTHHYVTNQLVNDSFETQVSGWNRRAAPGGAVNWALYGGGYDDTYRLDFNCAGTVAGCSIYQDVPFNTSYNDLFYFEVIAKCQNATPCPIMMALWGLGVTANEAVTELQTLPADGQWYRLRMRGTHFSPHSLLRFEIYGQNASTTVSLDMATLHWSDTSSASTW